MQGVLGINHKKPLIYIQKSKDEKEINVYIGLAFFETIPNDSKSFQFRYFVARLAKSGFSLASIARAFGINELTVKNYRNILISSQNEQELFERLIGLHCKKTKMTPEIEAFAHARFGEIYSISRKDYNKKLRKEILQTFGVTLSSESLRRLIAPLRKETDNQAISKNDAEHTDLELQTTEIFTVDKAPEINTATDISQLESIYNLLEDTVTNKSCNDDNKQVFFRGAGLLVLNLWLQKFVSQIKVETSPLLQWLYQILCGVVNFEQARYFPRHEIETFTGSKTAGVTQSRHHLWTMAFKDFDNYVQALFDANLNFVSAPNIKNNSCYFYIDGHFDPYFGKLGILKGWCAIKNRLMKGTNHYVLHNDKGYPVITELKDCFDGFRHSIKTMIPRILSLVRHLPQVRPGLIYDRGGFSEQLFEEHDSTQTNFITWEVGFKAPDEKELKFDGQLTLYQEKNDIGKFKKVFIDFLETTYQFSSGYKCRKFIIKRDDEQKPMFASILSNDWINDGSTIITYILTRWMCQENDFKYEKAHFGLDKITSYAYQRPSLTDRIQQEKGELQALEKQIEQLKEERQKLLQPLGVKTLTKRKIEQIQKAASINDEMTDKLQIVHQYKEIKLKIVKFRDRYNKKQKALKRKEKIEANGYTRLDLRQKQILDQLKIVARNIFYNAIEEFRQYYGNLRNMHVVLRQLTQTPGSIVFSDNNVQVNLQHSFTGKAEKAVEQFLEYLNTKSMKMLDGSNRTIQFNLND